MSLETTVLTFDTLRHQTPHEIQAEIAPVWALKVLRLEPVLLFRVHYVESIENGVRLWRQLRLERAEQPVLFVELVHVAGRLSRFDDGLLKHFVRA